MRVLLIAPEFPPDIGGMQSHAGETASRLQARGHELLVLTSRRIVARPGDFSFDAEPVLSRNLRATRAEILDAARRLSPDVLLIMNAGFAPAAVRSRNLLPPVVVRTAGNDAYGAWYGPRLPLRFLFWHLPYQNPNSLGATLRRVDQDRRVAAVVSALACCDRILCNSSYSLSRLRDLGVPGQLLHQMVGGVDTESFRPPGPEDPPDSDTRRGAILGIVGHLLPIKGIDLALRMLPLLGAASRHVTLRLAGGGPEEERLRDLARSLGVVDRVAFLGNLGPADLRRFYRELDVYLQPSVEIRHAASGIVQAETMGRAICEASACGVPVVASRTGGIPDVVEDGVTGLLVEPNDPAALAAAVAGLLASPEKRRRLGAAGRRLAVERFSWPAVIRQTEEHLEAARRSPV